MRSYYFDRPDSSAPPLGYPPDAGELVEIQADWTVWTFGDVHGVLTSLRDGLQRAGLISQEGAWTGGPRVALVGLGDYIDRGQDSSGVVAFLRNLADDMATAGSRLVLVRGNHEQMLADILRGSGEWFAAWAANGGHAFARSYGLAGANRPMALFCDAVRNADPELLGWLLQTLPFARWRDVLFVHAGIPRGADLISLLSSDGQLWDADSFVIGAGIPLDPDLSKLRESGIARVVVGHVPQRAGPTIEHDGTLLLIDTVALEGAGWLTLAKIPPSGSFATTWFTLSDVGLARDRPRG